MDARTQSELQQAIEYLWSGGPDKDGAIRGINDLFWQSLIEDGLMDETLKFVPRELGSCEFAKLDPRQLGQPLRKGHPRFYALLEELADLHERKNQNYATDADPLRNLKDCADLGITPFRGVMVRLCDKWARIKNLSKGVQDMVGESIVDTLKDMAIYCLLAIILWEERAKSEN